MRYPASEKLEIIRLVERSHLPVRRTLDKLGIPATTFYGIFANAALFHVPSQEIARVLGELNAALKPQGVLFCSNPRGDNQEGWLDGRYGCFHDLETWRDYVTGAGFTEVMHYYRPPGRPRHEQPWLATVWRKP